jgi:predicted tellurium resistance membrane protein TerC
MTFILIVAAVVVGIVTILVAVFPLGRAIARAEALLKQGHP